MRDTRRGSLVVGGPTQRQVCHSCLRTLRCRRPVSRPFHCIRFCIACCCEITVKLSNVSDSTFMSDVSLRCFFYELVIKYAETVFLRTVFRVFNTPGNLLELFFHPGNILEIYKVSWKFSGFVCKFAHLSLILVTILVFQSVSVQNISWQTRINWYWD